jgi:hypothetical protein
MKSLIDRCSREQGKGKMVDMEFQTLEICKKIQSSQKHDLDLR